MRQKNTEGISMSPKRDVLWVIAKKNIRRLALTSPGCGGEKALAVAKYEGRGRQAEAGKKSQWGKRL